MDDQTKAGTTVKAWDSGKETPGSEPTKEPKAKEVKERMTKTEKGSPGKTVKIELTGLERKNLILATVVIVLGLITIGTWAAVASWDDEDKVQSTARLRVDKVMVLMKEENQEDQTYTLDLVMFITNPEDEQAENVHIEAAGVDYNSKLTYAIGDAQVNDIEGKRTEEVHVVITIPIVDTYKAQIMVFQDNTIKIKGYNLITVQENVTGPRKDFNVYYSQERTNRVLEKGDDDISESTIFIGYLFYIILVMELYFVIQLIDFKVLRSAIGKIVGQRKEK